MAKELRIRRGTTVQHSTFTGAPNEVTADTTKRTLVLHDGATVGGFPLATEAAVNAKQNSDAELTTLAGMSADRATFLASTQPFSMRNRLINSDMRIDQRNAGASVTAVNGDYTIDRWRAISGAASKFSIGRSAGGVTPPTSFTNYLGLTSLSAYTVGASETFAVRQPIEGFNTADLGWGTANAQAVTLSFWVRSSLTGTFGATLRNSAQDRTYPLTYTVSAANTWEFKTANIAGDTSGTWLTNNGIGIELQFSIGAGSSVSGGTANAWNAGSFQSPSGCVSVVGTNGATLYITGVQLEAGTVASPFERRDYGRELMMCQRYFQKIASGAASLIGVGWFWTSTVGDVYIPFKTSMRASPSVSQVTGTNYFNLQALSTAFNFSGFAGIDMVSPDGVTLYATGLPSGTVGATGYMYSINAASFLAMTAEL